MSCNNGFEGEATTCHQSELDTSDYCTECQDDLHHDHDQATGEADREERQLEESTW